jgi:cytochrome c oxidase subunit 2
MTTDHSQPRPEMPQEHAHRFISIRQSTWAGLASITSVAAILLCGCHSDHPQSVLHPASPASEHIAWLWWVLFGVCTAVFAAVMILLAIAIRPRTGQPASPSPIGNKFIVVCGIILPAFILFGLLVVTLRAQVALEMPPTEVTIRVTGHMWWWEVEYPDHGIITANEIQIPVGQPVRIELQAADVIHSLWVPNLQGKMDLLPDKTNVTWLVAERPGIFRGQCAEYCGVQHALMGLVVVALPREAFDQWIADRQQPQPVVESELVRRGREVFFESTCHNCHSIAGSEAVGIRGPDLTHLASRQTIGAGLLPNNRGNLSGWISNPQALKPGNLMPYTHIDSEDFHALIAYLESLK